MSLPQAPDVEAINIKAEERSAKRIADIEKKAETKAGEQKELAAFQRQQAAFRTGTAPGPGNRPRRRQTLLSTEDADVLAQTGTIKKKTLLGQ